MTSPCKKKTADLVIPMVTPLTKAGSLDDSAVERLVLHLAGAGADGLLLLGTTGEGPSVDAETRLRLIARARSVAPCHLRLYATALGNCLEAAAAEGQAVLELGAEAAVIQLPNYYPLGAEEQSDWLSKLVNCIAGPVLLYNIPASVHSSIALEVVKRLSEHEYVLGIKDSEYDSTRQKALIELFRNRGDFRVFTGAGPYMLDALMAGADGIVPGFGNIVPGLYRRLVDSACAGNDGVARLTWQSIELVTSLFGHDGMRVSPIVGQKALLSREGLCGPTVAPPLIRAQANSLSQLYSAMDGLQVA